MWNIETNYVYILINKLQKISLKKKNYAFSLGKKTIILITIKVNALISFELVWTHQVHFWFFPWYLKRYKMVVFLGLPDLTILFKIHMPLCKLWKPIMLWNVLGTGHGSLRWKYIIIFQKSWKFKNKFSKKKNLWRKTLNLKNISFVEMKVSTSINYSTISCMLCWSWHWTTTVMDTTGLET